MAASTREADPRREPWLTLRDLCARFDVDKSTVYRWMRERGFPKPVQLGGGGTSRWSAEEVRGYEERAERSR